MKERNVLFPLALGFGRWKSEHGLKILGTDWIIKIMENP